eukprot:GILJ01003418.1.p1 GENE.GILJ01003418.1~~GILJ01003418.1.p1  ORF type:complete len:111 (-),score=11.71 GILJ01003418.1:87-419(-)
MIDIFEDLGLSDVDYVVLHRFRRHVVRFDNIRSSAKSGRSFFIEISVVRSKANSILSTLKAEAFDWGAAILGASVVLALSFFMNSVENKLHLRLPTFTISPLDVYTSLKL